MALILKRSTFLPLIALLLSCAHSPAPAQAGGNAVSLKTIQNSGGGTIVWGAVPGQQTYRTILSMMLKRVESDYGDRPQMGNMLQSQNGNFWEGFFTFANKKQSGNAPMTGAVIIYAPQSGTAGGATLIDTTANFPKSGNSMLQTLVQAVRGGPQTPQNTTAGASSAPAASSSSAAPSSPSAPAPGPLQKLTPYAFPDGTGSISLPANWKVIGAQMGDVRATGPNGEMLNFGFVVEALDPNLPSSRSMANLINVTPGKFVMVPFNEEPVKIFEDTVSQLSKQLRVPASTFTATQTQDLPAGNTGGKIAMFYGTVARNDGSAPVDSIIELICSPENRMGYEIKIYQITASDQVFKQEGTGFPAIFHSYSANYQLISQKATASAQAAQQAANNFIDWSNRQMDATDRSTQGMSDMLRGQSVLVDNSTGQHYRGPDDLASALQNANPNRFQTLSPGQYLSGVDY